MSIDLNFVELTADVLEIFYRIVLGNKNLPPKGCGLRSPVVQKMILTKMGIPYLYITWHASALS